MMRATLVATCFGLAAAFCEDGVGIPTVAEKGDVTVTWVQAPLMSNNPEIGQKGKYLNLYHTALVFRQDSKYWTLEFDSTNSDLTKTIIPVIEGGEIMWAEDARWCLRDGIFNGRDHWTTHFDDVATISPAQFLKIMYDFIPRFNSSVPGAFPQYQFMRVQNFNGTMLFDDTTCGHVYRVLEYLRQEQQVPVLKMDYKATRTTLPATGWTEVDMSNSDQKAEVLTFYTKLDTIVRGKGGARAFYALMQLAETWEFVYEPLAQKYYKIHSSPGAATIFANFVKYDIIGDLPAPPGSSCNVAPVCADAMATHATYGMGQECKDALGHVSDNLVTAGCHEDATARAEDVNCFCGSQCYVHSTQCLAKMSEHCTRGGGDSCVTCMVWAFPQIALFGPCEASWSPNAIVSASAARACFCDVNQWKPSTTSVIFA